MTFYEAMQLGTSTLKPMIKEEDNEKLKKKYKMALISKTVLCVIFCMIFVTPFSNLFGSENSIVGVIGVILLLTFRFSNLDFNVKQSALTLFLVFVSLIFLPLIAAISNPILGAIINFISILGLTLVCCHNVLYSNQSVIVLSYLLLYGNPVMGSELIIKRGIALVVAGLIVSVIFYIRNRKLEFENTFLTVLKDFNFNDDRSKWQLKLAFGISLAMLIGQLLGIPRVMWIGFTCMSIIQPLKEKLQERLVIRPFFCIVGCIVFFVTYLVIPDEYIGMIGILGGILVGFSATYNWQTVFNCFGALSVAIPMFGLSGAIIVRILTNTIGAIFSKMYDYLFERVYDNLTESNEVIDC
ncbi:MAG: FUSC family protein [Clostridium sp.]